MDKELRTLLNHIISQQNRIEGRLARLEAERELEALDNLEDCETAGWVDDYFADLQCLPVSDKAIEEILKYNHIPYMCMATIRDAVRWAEWQRLKKGEDRSKYYDEVDEALTFSYDHMWNLDEQKWDVGEEY